MSHQHSDQLNELAAALAKAQANMRPAVKDSANPFFKSRYADLGSVIEAAREALADNGLAVSSLPNTDEKGGLVLTTYLLHASGQWLRSDYPVNPVKADPQGEGSAITYARRYALMSILNVATADDDGEGAMGRNDDRHHAPARRQAPQYDPAQVPATLRGGPQSVPRGRGRPPKAQAPQPVETSELFQEVMETIREATGPEDLATASQLAMDLEGEEQAQARAAWRARNEGLKAAASRSDAARDSIKASLTLPKPA